MLATAAPSLLPPSTQQKKTTTTTATTNALRLYFRTTDLHQAVENIKYFKFYVKFVVFCSQFLCLFASVLATIAKFVYILYSSKSVDAKQQRLCTLHVHFTQI